MIISIHALHEESDLLTHVNYLILILFQSTLSMRRATLGSMWGNLNLPISIHALHEESDPTTLE